MSDSIDKLFVEVTVPADAPLIPGGPIYRTCGCCLTPKELEVEFYKDGKDSEGNNRYRRDCKECYRVTRLRARQAKRAPAPAPKKRGRKRK